LKIFKLFLVFGIVTSEEYKNRNKRRDAMEHLANKYQMPRRETEKKIHNLKCQFGREHKKFNESKKNRIFP